MRQVITLRSGIPKDKSKPLMEEIKSLKLKVNAQYQDEQIRVTGKNHDDLQKVIAALKGDGFRTAAAVRELPVGAAECHTRRVRQPRLR